MGLPDELQLEIVRHAVAQTSPIPAELLKVSFRRLLAPLATYDHLLAMAEIEVYKANTFVEESMAVKKFPRTGERFLPSHMNPPDRFLVQHLRLHFDLELQGGEVNEAFDSCPARFGAGIVDVLELLPSVYPNLSTLQLDLSIDHSKFHEVYYQLAHANGRSVRSAKWRGWELDGTLHNIIMALSKYESGKLQSKALTLTQAPMTRPCGDDGSTAIDIAQTPRLEDVVWQAMDLPVCRLPVVALHCPRKGKDAGRLVFK